MYIDTELLRVQTEFALKLAVQKVNASFTYNNKRVGMGDACIDTLKII